MSPKRANTARSASSLTLGLSPPMKSVVLVGSKSEGCGACGRWVQGKEVGARPGGCRSRSCKHAGVGGATGSDFRRLQWAPEMNEWVQARMGAWQEGGCRPRWVVDHRRHAPGLPASVPARGSGARRSCSPWRSCQEHEAKRHAKGKKEKRAPLAPPAPPVDKELCKLCLEEPRCWRGRARRGCAEGACAQRAQRVRSRRSGRTCTALAVVVLAFFFAVASETRMGRLDRKCPFISVSACGPALRQQSLLHGPATRLGKTMGRLGHWPACMHRLPAQGARSRFPIPIAAAGPGRPHRLHPSQPRRLPLSLRRCAQQESSQHGS